MISLPPQRRLCGLYGLFLSVFLAGLSQNYQAEPNEALWSVGTSGKGTTHYILLIRVKLIVFAKNSISHGRE